MNTTYFGLFGVLGLSAFANPKRLFVAKTPRTWKYFLESSQRMASSRPWQSVRGLFLVAE